MHGHTTEDRREGVLRQSFIVALLVGVLILFHHIQQPEASAIDSTAMLALGFVILASYTVGVLGGVIKLPHITGYLLAGMVLGPSFAALLTRHAPDAIPPPFDHGLLNEGVMGHLHLLEVLAIGLIAVSAGGELRIDSLRRGLRAILGVLGVQFVMVMGLVTGLFVAIGGAIPALTMPGLESLDPSGTMIVGLMIGSIAFATAPAATLAVIDETDADGPMSRTVMSAVILKDVVVVVAFAITAVLAAKALGLGGNEGNLATELSWHVFGSLAVGAVFGLAMAAYLRFVNKQLLLFLVFVIYLATFSAGQAHLDPVLLFLSAGFTVSNFSKLGHDLLHSVEKLAMPVYVVFFTLAGAHLPLDKVAAVWPFALALVLTRAFAVFVGVRFGARLAGADDATRKYGWMGFISQAGVSITLSQKVGTSLGETGEILATLLIAGVALNELAGPVLLKVGLGLAGEIGKDPGAAAEAAAIAAARASATGTEIEGAATTTPDDDGDEGHEGDEEEETLEAWPDHPRHADLWGTRARYGDPALDDHVAELGADLAGLVRDMERGPLEDFRRQAEGYLRELRREFLRHHRRLAVQARTSTDRSAMAATLRTEQSELAERWRGSVLGRSARLSKGGWRPDALVASLDDLVDGLPEVVHPPYDDVSFVDRADQTTTQAIRRALLRTRRSMATRFGGSLGPRRVPLRELGRYHLAGRVPEQLEGLAALLVQADRHLAARTRSLFDGIVRGYDSLARQVCDADCDPHERLVAIRGDVETELVLALDEVDRMAQDAAERTARILAAGLRRLERDVRVAGTLDLPRGTRRTSRVFRRRMRALDTLAKRVEALRGSSAAGYSLLAMELELVGLEARVKEALEEHVTKLESEVRGRSHKQLARVEEALAEAVQHVESELQSDYTGGELSGALRRVTELPERVAAEASRMVSQLHDELSDETRVSHLLEALSAATGSLTDHYRILVGREDKGEWRLPEVASTIDVPFREVVLTFVEARITPSLLGSGRSMAERLRPLIASLNELERLVAFNVELATAELEVVHDEAVPTQTRSLLQEMVAGQLERSQQVVRGQVETSKTWPAELGVAMRDAVLGGIEELRGQLVDGEISRARLDAMRRVARGRRIIRRAERLPDLLAQAREQGQRAVLAVVGEDRLEVLRRTLGLPQPKASEQIDPRAFDRPRPTADLPPVYKRLFASETLEAGDVLTGREEAIERAERVLGAAHTGRLRSVALIGIDGVGKAAVSNAIVRGRGAKGFERVLLTSPVGLAEVDAIFKDRDRGEGKLIVIEGLQWMMSLEPAGFVPLRRFVQGVIADRGRNSWLVHADLLWWRHASRVAALEDAFPEAIFLEPLDAEELRSAVMARHRLSGYGHAFERLEGTSQIEGIVERGASRIRRPYDRYFEDLHLATGGLVRDALRMWLASIRELSQDDIVRVGRVPASPYNALRRLPEDVLLNLYQIARQGWVNARVQATIYRTDEGTARAQLARLAHLGLLEDKEGVYRVAVHLRGAIVRVFHDRGWLS